MKRSFIHLILLINLTLTEIKIYLRQSLKYDEENFFRCLLPDGCR